VLASQRAGLPECSRIECKWLVFNHPQSWEVRTHSRYLGESEMNQTTRDAITVGNAIRLAEVRRMTGLGRSTIYRLQANQQFPQSINLGIRSRVA
jgi:predicted DNA-binding transcriptional regulator AlpA